MVTSCHAFLRGSFSESELPLSYNAKVTNDRAINWLRDQPFEQGMTIYIYIYIYSPYWLFPTWPK